MLPLTHSLLLALLPPANAEATEPRPRLALHVYDEHCDPARVDGNSWAVWGPPERFLYCVRCPKGETPRPGWNTPEAAGSSSPGRGDTIFYVEPGERYVYAYVGKDIQPVEGEVTIAPFTPWTVRELHVEPEVKKQALRVHLTRPDGSPLAHDFQVRVESLATGLPLFEWESLGAETRYGDVLPVGRYRVRVTTEESFPGCASGWMPKPAPFGAWVETVDLTPERPVEIESSVWFGGKLRLTLDVPRETLPIQDSWRERFPTNWNPPEVGWLVLGARGPGARVTLRPDPDVAPEPRERGMPEFSSNTLHFFFGRPAPHGRLHLDGILPGDTQTTSDWIPPGAYIARIEARDFEPVETKVKVRVGETTECRVRLTAR